MHMLTGPLLSDFVGLETELPAKMTLEILALDTSSALLPNSPDKNSDSN